MSTHAHIHKLDQLHCRGQLIAEALVAQKSIFLGDLLLQYDGLLRTFKLKPDHVPVNLQAFVSEPLPAPLATCEGYLRLGQRNQTHWHIEEIFSTDTKHEDFDEVELGASS